MGATWAIVTHRWPCGAVTYINSHTEPSEFIRLMGDLLRPIQPPSPKQHCKMKDARRAPVEEMVSRTADSSKPDCEDVSALASLVQAPTDALVAYAAAQTAGEIPAAAEPAREDVGALAPLVHVPTDDLVANTAAHTAEVTPAAAVAAACVIPSVSARAASQSVLIDKVYSRVPRDSEWAAVRPSALKTGDIVRVRATEVLRVNEAVPIAIASNGIGRVAFVDSDGDVRTFWPELARLGLQTEWATLWTRRARFRHLELLLDSPSIPFSLD